MNLPVSDINWLEADGDYTRLLKASLSSLSNKELSELEQKPDPQQFKRIRRSTIINLHGVKEVFREPSRPQVVLLN